MKTDIQPVLTKEVYYNTRMVARMLVVSTRTARLAIRSALIAERLPLTIINPLNSTYHLTPSEYQLLLDFLNERRLQSLNNRRRAAADNRRKRRPLLQKIGGFLQGDIE